MPELVTWLVNITIDKLVTTEQLPSLQLFAYRALRVPEYHWTQIDILVAAVTARQALNEGLDRVGVILQSAAVEGNIVRAHCLTEVAHLRLLAHQRRMPEIVGVAEIQQILQVNTRQQVSQLAERPNFPRPVAQLTAGRIWLRHEIEEFKQTWHRRPGRSGL